MTFGETYIRMLEGYKIRRESWPEGCYVRTPHPGAMHLVLCTRGQVCTRWSPRIDDLYDKTGIKLADDWQVIK
jgi:hypothetical protein